MTDLLVTQYKKKEFERLAICILNQISIIEVGLNPNSISRGINAHNDIIAPSPNEIAKLCNTLWQLRENILTPEERELLK